MNRVDAMIQQKRLAKVEDQVRTLTKLVSGLEARLTHLERRG